MAEDLLTRENESVAEQQLRVYLSADRTEVLLDCSDVRRNPALAVESILGECQLLELPEYPGRETLTEMLEQSEDDCLVEHVLVRGKKPVPPVHGTLQWSREFFAEGWVIDEETDNINYREKVANASVRHNELLGRRTEPVEGVCGEDVFGQVIEVEKPESQSLRCGKGVLEVVEDDFTNYFAEIDGRVTFKDNVLSVDEVYAINGHVDLKSGNIRHTGSITVNGDIRNGALVEADGDILVKGLVEQSDIRCGGNLVVAGGIIGDQDRHITVEGNVEARYIRDANLDAKGNIMVVREISHSQVRTLGGVQMPKGRIAGGKTTSLKGILVDTAGAPGSADTVLKAGVDFTLKEKLNLLQEKINRLESNLVPVEAALKNIEQNTEEKSAAVITILGNLKDKQQVLIAAIKLEKRHKARLTDEVDKHGFRFVVMTHEVWSGTTIFLGDAMTRVKRSIPKPRIALMKENRARVVPLGESNQPPAGFCGGDNSD